MAPSNLLYFFPSGDRSVVFSSAYGVSDFSVGVRRMLDVRALKRGRARNVLEMDGLSYLLFYESLYTTTTTSYPKTNGFGKLNATNKERRINRAS